MTADPNAVPSFDEDEAMRTNVTPDVSGNNHLPAELASFPLPPGRKGSVSSRLTGVDPLDSSNPIEGHMPGSFPDSMATFDGPSSAPPTPSVISVTHPSQFIHTHHPRRGSLTPLGLNVISPVPPQLQQENAAASSSTSPPLSSSPMRTIGFHAADGSAYSLEPARRDSVATVSSSASKTSVASNLTATRPGYSSGGGGSFYRRSSLTPSLSNVPPPASQSQTRLAGSTPLFDPSRRRGSLTPSWPTLSAPSPTRAIVAGRLVAKASAGELPTHASTVDVLPNDRRGSATGLAMENRRGSLPQLYYGAWTGPGDRRNSGDSEVGATIKRGFKFGSINSAEPDNVEGAASSLQRIAQLSSAKKTESSAFEAAEQAEAERQRRAFLAATYGEEGRRARARLSLGGNSASPASPASTRRQSLMLWERIKGSDGSASAGHGTSTNTSSGDEIAGTRRPSLPVNIPRTPRGADHSALFDDQTVWDNPDHLPDAEDLGVSLSEWPGPEHHDPTPQRPLPPLLPLSDPVPRLLPSTLALHRASHLLNARNLASEPLPAPLPPSLHPPQPVDLSEFDIDFILAGSRSQLGRASSKNSQHRSIRSGRGSEDSFGYQGGSRPPGPEEEDSFAKFVGAFDDEYGGRRGEWTFRARPRPVQPKDQDPTRPVPRAEWESPGAGKYEIYPNGDVRSVESGSVWRMKRTSTREYELEQPLPGLRSTVNVETPPPNAPQPVILSPCSGYTLTSKLVHTENGGVKLPIPVQRELSRSSRFSRRFAAAARNRQSITDSLYDTDDRKRTGSQDSGATATAQGRPILAPPAMRSHSSNNSSNQSNNTPPSLSPPKDELGRDKRGSSKPKKEMEDDKNKKDKGFSGVLKRGLFKATNMLEESKERGKFWPNGGNSTGSYSFKSSAPIHRPLPHQHSDRSDAASASSQHSSKYTSESADEEQSDELFGTLGLGIEDEQNGGHPWKEGKAWEVVPDDALAMVIPIESDKSAPPLPNTPAATKAFINPFFVDGPRQALLVWFTPFNAAGPPERPERQGSSTLFKITESPHHEMWEGSPGSSSLSRLPKLLRPRGSNQVGHGSLHGAKHIPIMPPTSTPPTDDDYDVSRSSSRASRNLQQLPFKGYRVVAKVVDTEDLRSQSEIPVIGLEAWTEQLRTGKPAGTPVSDAQARAELEAAEASRSPSLHKDSDSSVMSGRAFPTVIAVCHNQSSGVEFVLEGLDRLGLCKGESAWGPTGYEEWRGTGLSDNGRQLLDLLWAACTSVMGI